MVDPADINSNPITVSGGRGDDSKGKKYKF